VQERKKETRYEKDCRDSRGPTIRDEGGQSQGPGGEVACRQPGADNDERRKEHERSFVESLCGAVGR